MKTKILNFIKNILLKLYLRLDRLDKQPKPYKDYIHDRVMAEFHY